MTTEKLTCAQHFRNIHPDVNSDEYEQASVVSSETEFPRNCGFCKHKFDSRQDRIDHIAEHFKQGKCMLDWNDESNDDADNSDNTDDDDDNDKPSGDGSDSGPPHPPPQSDPRDRFDSQYYGGGDYGGGGSSGGGSGPDLLPDSFFQFRISSGSDKIDVTQQLQSEQQVTRDRLSCAPDPQEEERSSSIPASANGCEIRARRKPTTRGNKTSLAGDALSGQLVGGAEFSSQPLVARGIRLSKDSDDLIPDAANRLPGLLDSQTDPAGRNTKNSPSRSSVQHSTEELRIPTSAVLGLRTEEQSDLAVLAASNTNTKAASSTAVLDTLQHFTPQSFLSVRLLGAGGFSTVDEVLHRATNLRLGRKTLKNRNPTAIEELKKEVSVLQKLRHPHVIRFMGAYSKGDKMSILVSPVAETTLALWLEQATLQQPANLVNIISKMFGCLVSSVRYLHEQRPVVKHMDIKPQNILVAHGDQEFPHVVLCDFGISSSDDLNDGQHKPLTRRYVAPEVFNGFTRKQAADIWSLGCVFAEMASAPFSKTNTEWLSFRREYSGRTGKHYWQDIPSLQDRLSGFLNEAATPIEQQVVLTLQDMLNADPNGRPSAALLSLKFTPAPCCLEWPNDKVVFPAPDQELEAVETLVRNDGFDCCDHLDTAGVTDHQNEDVFNNAKLWMDECSRTHDTCRPLVATDRILPTRLVDTQPEGAQDSIIRIIDSAVFAQDTKAVEYVTLSHVWSNTTAKLTTDRLQNAQLGLQRQTLPKALESGIQAAQKLGFRYIWIDSLCIVQDSETDKHVECAKMASVFRNAALTIVLDQINEDKPTTIETSSGVVLPDENSNAPSSLVRKSAAQLSAASSLPVSDFVTPGFGWDTRAWALQERLLCGRLLHLCERQLYWECASLKASDTFPRGLSPLVWEKAHSKSRHDRPQRGKSGSQSVTVKNTRDMQPLLGATPLRNCQWIHREGAKNGDSMDVAHSTEQPAAAKAPLSSKGVFAPKYARKNSSVGAAPSTHSAGSAVNSTNDNVGSFNASGPWTGTTATAIASEDRTSLDRSTSPYLKGLFGLASLSDIQTSSIELGTTFQKVAGPQPKSTDAHPALSKVYRGSEISNSVLTSSPTMRMTAMSNTNATLNQNSLHDHVRRTEHTHHTGPKLRHQHRAARSNDNAALVFASNCVGTNAAPFWDSDRRLANVEVTEHPLCDAAANTLAHQLESGVRSHPCAGRDGQHSCKDGTSRDETVVMMEEEDGTKV